MFNKLNVGWGTMDQLQNERKAITNLYLYSTGKTISVFGSAIYSFALGLYVLKLTGSSLSFAVTLMLGVVPMIIINPFAGVIADKFNKKKLVVSMDLLNGLMLVCVYVLSIRYELNLTLIYITTFLLTVFSTFFGVGIESAKPNMVTEKMLMNLNSISKIIDSVSLISGPMVGGIVFVVLDIKIFILINGISFIFSGLLMIFINFKLTNNQSNERIINKKINFITDIKEGFHYLLEKKTIIGIFSILISLNFFLGFTMNVPLPYIINTVLKLSSKQFGIIQGSFPVGMIFGALFVKKVLEKTNYTKLLKDICISLSILMITSGIPVLLKGIYFDSTIYLIYYCGTMFLFGVLIAFIDLPISYTLQKEIPDEFRGRVMSIGISIGKTMLPVAMILSGVLLKVVPSYFILFTGGILFLLINMLINKKNSNKVKVELSVENSIAK